MQDGNAKQLLSERIKNATNILVTVSRDPSVDELSAALGLTLMLNKLDKHATAVFSGALPPAIEFLQPEKTFEGTVDSLRDFIIALDKEKADRLRYKVEDDVVRIFITPYKTVISDKDLQFSQGDFNVELIVALGVEKREDLDNAITAHGRILHDATVVTINANNQKSSLGSIDWSDANASSLCEMLMSLSESLQSGILDQQISTALLTGIVAATDRFSNTHTSPKVMTMAAQLMAAGANQQLIATKLEEGNEIPAPQPSAPDGSQKLNEGESHKLDKEEPTPPVEEKKSSDGEMHIDHEAAASEQALPPVPAPEASPRNHDNEAQMAERLVESMPVQPTLSVDDLKKDLAAANEALDQAAEESPVEKPSNSHKRFMAKSTDGSDQGAMGEPAFGGTLNATTDEAEADKRREEESRRNHVLLSHDSGPASGSQQASLGGSGFDPFAEPPTVDPFAEPLRSEPDAPMHYEPTPLPPPEELIQPAPPGSKPEEPKKAPTLAEIEAEARRHANDAINQPAPQDSDVNSLDDARAAVDAALSSVPFNPAHQPLESAGAAPLAEVDHTPASAAPVLPPPPPLPDFSKLPPLPGDPMGPPPPIMAEPTVLAPAMPPQPVTPPEATDPGQFKLPGQQ